MPKTLYRPLLFTSSAAFVPTILTSFPIGVPGGQQPYVHVRDTTIGADLYTLNPDTQSVYPASCTKLMTLLLAWEYKNAVWTSESVTITSGDVTQPIAGITLDETPFQAGDVVNWQSLAYAILLPSGTDACLAVSRVIGDLIYANAGNTGTQSTTRFIEQMNIRAGQLGMTNTLYFDPYGGSQTNGPTVTRNKISARDLSTVCTKVFSYTALRTIAQAPTYGIPITGGRTTTLNVTGYNRFANGPTLNQSSITDPNLLGAKNGVWVVSGATQFNLSMLYKAPNGNEIIITTIGSESLFTMMLDQRGIIYSMIRDFPYLDSGSVGNDPNWTNVKMLVGADSNSVTDESTAARTITNSGVTFATGVIKNSNGSMNFTGNTNTVSTADASDIKVGSGDMTIETWYAGNGSSGTPLNEYVFFCKRTAGSQNEWLINDFNGAVQVFVSTNGSGWNSAVAYNLTTGGSNDRLCFYNGAPRHLAYVKHGSEWSLYINGEKMTGTLTFSSPFAGTGPLTIGDGANSVTPLAHYDDFRATFGTARYTANMVTLDPRKYPRS